MVGLSQIGLYTLNQLNNPNWPFPIHNGKRTLVSKSLLQKDSTYDLEVVLYYDPVYELDGADKEEKVKEKLLEVAAYNEMSEGLTNLMSIGFIVKKLKEQSDDVDAFEYLDIVKVK